jgi:hypothetical protein
MTKIFLILLNLWVIGYASIAQTTHNSWQYPAEQGRILYEYSGNVEGQRELFFKDFGKEQALYTRLVRNSTFFAVKTSTAENVVEIYKEGKHYHFDLDNKNGMTIDFPIHLLHKYFRIPDNVNYRDGLLDIGAQLTGREEIMGYSCEIWTYRSKTCWVWEGLLLKMESTGLNKNFTMEAVEIDFNREVDREKFRFPKKIPLKLD